jgi:DNA-binding FadR family transcriptional regulator
MLAGTSIDDVWDARLTIEPSAVRELAETATDGQLAALEEELHAVRTAAELDPAEFHRAGVRFHVHLIELSGNRTLAAVIGMLSEIIERELGQTLAELGPRSEEIRRANRRALRGYERITALIRSADGAAAESAWHEHIATVRRYVGRARDDDGVLDVLY